MLSACMSNGRMLARRELDEVEEGLPRVESIVRGM